MRRCLLQLRPVLCCWAVLLSTVSACVRAPLPDPRLNPQPEPADLLSSPEAFSLPMALSAESSSPPTEAVRSGDQLLEDGFQAPGAPPLPELPEADRPFSERGLEFGIIPEAQWADRAPGQGPRPLRPPSEAGRDVPGLAFPAQRSTDPLGPLNPPTTPASADGTELPPESWPVPARIAQAWRTYYDASPAAALPQFALLLEQAPERADVHLGLGRCLLARGELDAAYERLEDARRLAQESDPEPEFYLGLVAYQRGHFREAAARWTGLVARLDRLPPGPLHRDHAWLLARARLALGDRTGGEDAFRRALALGGEQADGTLNPPPLELEYLPDGRLPGGDFLPVAQRGSRTLSPALLLELEGAIWRLAGSSVLLERLTHPPPGWQDSAPVPVPGGSGPAGEPTPGMLIFLARDPEGRTFLMQQALRPSPGGAASASGQGGAGGLELPPRQRLLPEPVEPVRPALSPDRTLVAFVRLTPVGEEGQREPRLFLLRRSALDLLPVAWPALPVGEPAFSALGELIFPVQEGDAWHLVRLMPGALEGESLPDFPLVRLGAPQTEGPPSTSSPYQRLHDPARAPLTARSKPRPAPAPPLQVQEPWSPSDSARGSLPPDPPASATPAATSSTEQPPAAPPAPGSSAPQLEGDVRSPATALAPEVRRLYFVRSTGARRTVRLYDAQDRIERLISPEALDCHAPSVTADGRQVAFVCRSGSRQEVYLWNPQTERAERAFGMSLRTGEAVIFERP